MSLCSSITMKTFHKNQATKEVSYLTSFFSSPPSPAPFLPLPPPPLSLPSPFPLPLFSFFFFDHIKCMGTVSVTPTYNGTQDSTQANVFMLGTPLSLLLSLVPFSVFPRFFPGFFPGFYLVFSRHRCPEAVVQ